MLKRISYLRKNADVPSLMRHFILAWLLAVAIEYFLLPSKLQDLSILEGLSQMSLGRVIFLTFCFGMLLFILSQFKRIKEIEQCGIMLVFGLLAAGTIRMSAALPYIIACLFILGALFVYNLFDWNDKIEKYRIVNGRSNKNEKICKGIVLGLSILFFVFVSAWTVCRVYSFSTPTYDFGIFAQMFYNMKESGLPMTTVERDGLLSHFAVHVSPIYYLLLPFYWLFPVPATLQILQAFVVTSAVIPLWKIGKHHGLSGIQRMLLCVILLLYPAFSGATSYDIHENCFLTPLIFWIFYGIDKKNSIITVVSVILTLMVKEDAAVYVAVIALWLIIRTILKQQEMDKKNLVIGLVIFIISIGWFVLVTTYLAESGDGVMTYRYSNFMYDGSSSLITVIKAVILNPMKMIYECVDVEKIDFIAKTILPLIALPLFTRRYERYILLIPYILVNLMSDYTYQHDIMFQYTFGSTAFLFYLAVINLADMKVKWNRIIFLVSAMMVSAFYFYTIILPVGLRYTTRAVQYSDRYQVIRDVLDTIPDDASVAATTFYTTHLSQRETLYDVRYCSKEHLFTNEYVVLKIDSNSDCYKYATEGQENGFENLVSLLEKNGYQKYASIDHVLVIYQKEEFH